MAASFETRDISAGQPIGGVEKMSKSKKNVVDPLQIIADYGADVARWFVLSDSPPERDFEWSDAGVRGAWARSRRCGRSRGRMSGRRRRPRRNRRGRSSFAASRTRPSATSRSGIEKFHFNVGIARMNELANALRKAESQTGPGMATARREAIRVLSPVVRALLPHLAEECWQRIGQEGNGCDRALAQGRTRPCWCPDTVTLPVQINGKRRGEITLPAGRRPARPSKPPPGRMRP